MFDIFWRSLTYIFKVHDNYWCLQMHLHICVRWNKLLFDCTRLQFFHLFCIFAPCVPIWRIACLCEHVFVKNELVPVLQPVSFLKKITSFLLNFFELYWRLWKFGLMHDDQTVNSTRSVYMLHIPWKSINYWELLWYYSIKKLSRIAKKHLAFQKSKTLAWENSS